MSCSTCLQSKPIPICNTNLIIGSIADNDIDVIVKLKNLATGKTEYIPVTSGAAGEIELPGDDLKLMQHAYQISVSEEDDLLTEKQLTIGSETGTCVEFIGEQGEADEVEMVLR